MIGRKNWQGLAASFWLLASSAVAAQEIHESLRIEPTVVHLAPLDPDHPADPASNVLTIKSTAAGHVHVWATSTDFEPALRVEDALGARLGADDDSGGKHTPYLSIAVERDATLRVIVNCAKQDAQGNALLYVAEMPESEETLAEAQALRDALDESLRAQHDKNYPDSREMLREGVDHALSIAGAERSEALQDALYAIGTEFGNRDDNETSLRVNRALYDWFRATRPMTAKVLQVVRLRLAQDMLEVADSAHGLPVAEAALSCLAESLPDDHHDVQVARAIVARLLVATGDVERGAELYRKVIDVDQRSLAEDDENLAASRGNLGILLLDQGDAYGARVLFEQAIAAWQRVLPDEHPNLVTGYGMLASTLRVLGDHERARLLDDKVLAIRQRTLPADHPLLFSSLENLGTDLCCSGEFERALEVYTQSLDGYLHSLPETHQNVLRGRMHVGEVLQILGRDNEARELLEHTLETELATLPEDDALVQRTRGTVAMVMLKLGLYEKALELFDASYRVRARRLPSDHPHLQNSLAGLASAHAALGHHERTKEIASELARSVEKHICCAVLCMSPREVEAVVASEATYISAVLSIFEEGSEPALEPLVGVGIASAGSAKGKPDAKAQEHSSLDGADRNERARQTFLLVETARSAAYTAQRAIHALADSPQRTPILKEQRILHQTTARIAKLSRDADIEGQLPEAIQAKERAERSLLEQGGGQEYDGALARHCDSRSIAACLREGEVAIGFRVYQRASDQEKATAPPVSSLVAFVLRKDGSLSRLELGRIQPIEEAAKRWRDALLAPQRETADVGQAAGALLTTAIIEPLEKACAGARRWIVALDGPLQLIPLDALPTKTGIVGDQLTILVRPTLSEIAMPLAPASGSSELLALGGIDYDARSASAPERRTEPATSALLAAANVEIVRGGAWSTGFAPLASSGNEVHAIADVFQRAFGEHATVALVQGADASKSELVRRVGSARFLHIATHGYFARDTAASDPSELYRSDSIPLRTHRTWDDTVRDMSPLVLCGLALAGANGPANADGVIDGVITAEELGALDLSNCELAVLSACDTNVGERIAGQGIASFQKALHGAGARTVITSLWKVSDDSTRELMIAFYENIWIAKMPKAQALWKAKEALRAKRAPLRDWAGWVLSGDPH